MKPVQWIGSSLDDLREFPEEVRSEAGHSLYLAQLGGKAINAVPMVGFGGANVVEVVIDSAGNTFRAVYTVRFAKAIYVLHAFQKKSKRGSKTPEPDIRLIHQRLKMAKDHYQRNYEAQERRAHGQKQS